MLPVSMGGVLLRLVYQSSHAGCASLLASGARPRIILKLSRYARRVGLMIGCPMT